MGPSIAGAPNHYDELLSPGNGELIYRSGMAIHPYSFDTVEQMEEYSRIESRTAGTKPGRWNVYQ